MAEPHVVSALVGKRAEIARLRGGAVALEGRLASVYGGGRGMLIR